MPLLWPFARLADLLVWRKVRAALGGRQKLIVSGGSALPKLLEQFYEAAGIPVVSGYGLSETSPGTTYGRLSNRCRRPVLPFYHNRHQQTTTPTTLNTSDHHHHHLYLPTPKPVIAVRRADRNLVDGGVVGLPPKDVELQIRDIETGAALPDGQPGVVFTRGPQVMLGYYKDRAATDKVLEHGPGGWLNTGDLGFLNKGSGDLVLTGRVKVRRGLFLLLLLRLWHDARLQFRSGNSLTTAPPVVCICVQDVIVLANGENVEPQPLEDALLEFCPLVDQVMCVGQDRRWLGALAVVSPKVNKQTQAEEKQHPPPRCRLILPIIYPYGQALADRGLLSKLEAERLDAMVGPTAVLTGCVATSAELAAEAAKLNANPAIVRAVAAEAAAALSSSEEDGDGDDGVTFRPWEQVKGVYLLLEPFNAANGLLTQTLKIRRNVVAERYAKEIEGLYE